MPMVFRIGCTKRNLEGSLPCFGMAAENEQIAMQCIILPVGEAMHMGGGDRVPFKPWVSK